MSGAVTISQWTERRFEELELLSVSPPDPVLVDPYVVATTDDVGAARRIVTSWESLQWGDDAVATVVMGRSGVRPGHVAHHDSERVTGLVADRVLRGALPGAVIGALLIGMVALWLADGPGVIGGFVGGAIFGALIGGFWAGMSRLGGSAAYRATFVDPEFVEAVAVWLRIDGERTAQRAIDAVAGVPGVDCVVVDGDDPRAGDADAG